MDFLPLLEAKRDGGVLPAGDIQALVQAVVDNAIPDYQVVALLMAIYFRGLNSDETRTLTLAMRDSGETLSFPADVRPVVDKHSTGGVGDKVSLPLAPLLACLGFRVPMISGRGLGITGGTLDKLESIPGFRTRLSRTEIIRQVQDIGCVICGQTDLMVPADRKLYALRDVTGTVPSIPLITASILSKKLAEGLDALVLDVKFGRAAFMQTREEAKTLAANMVTLGLECGVKTRALLTDMNQPTGRAVGNRLEIREAVACLDGHGPLVLEELVLTCAAHLLEQTGLAANLEAGRRRAAACLASGAPRKKWDQMLAAQGADLPGWSDLAAKTSTARQVISVRVNQPGFVAAVDARRIGVAVRRLGGGRLILNAPIDHTVGMDELIEAGASGGPDTLLGMVHAADLESGRRAADALRNAIEWSPERPQMPSRTVETVGRS